MITELYIENYKCFGSPGVTIPIRPVTFLYGENSSGKTTVIEALKLVQKILSGRGSVRTELDDFRSFVHYHEEENNVVLGVKIDTSNSVERLRDLKEFSVFFSISLSKDSDYNDQISISRCEFHINNQIFTFYFQVSDNSIYGDWWFDYSESKITIQENTTFDFFKYSPALQNFLLLNYVNLNFYIGDSKNFPGKYNRSYIKCNDTLSYDQILNEFDTEEDVIQSFIEEFETIYTVLTEKIISEDENARKKDFFQEVSTIEKFKKYEEEFKVELTKVCDLYVGNTIEELLQKIIESLRIEFEDDKFVHTPPLRPLPRRRFIVRFGEQINEDHQYLYEILFSPKIRDRLNFILREVIGNHYNYLEAKKSEIVEYEDGYVLESNLSSLVWKMHNGNSSVTVDLQNIGFGYCQIIPLLVASIANEGKFVSVQQPEVHLHPKLQANITDVFILSAIGSLRAVDEDGNLLDGYIQSGHDKYKWVRGDIPNNYWFIESHSDMVALRALRRAVSSVKGPKPEWMCEINESDVTNLFFYREGENVIFEETTLDVENKTFKGGQWAREGFFPYLMEEYNEFN